MKKKTQVEEPAIAVLGEAPVLEFANTTAQALKGLIPAERGGRLTRAKAKEVLLSAADRAMAKIVAEVMAKVEAKLSGRKDVQAALAVHDYFQNAPVGTPLTIVNVADPVVGLLRLKDHLDEESKLVEIALLADLDPVPDPKGGPALQPVDEVCATIASHSEGGTMVHATATIAPKAFAELVQGMSKDSMLGQQPHRESVQIFANRVYQRADDPRCVTAHSPAGALLGKRMSLDVQEHPAEPMDGNRDSGRGAKGWLRGVQIAPVPGQKREYLEEQRNLLATYGLNTLRSWPGVGDAVVVTNRSLREGKSSVYVFASTARLRNLIQAVFHKTVEHEIRGAGQRSNGPLEKTMGLMNRLLRRLQKEGWLKDGSRVWVDYPDESQAEEVGKLRIKVVFSPVSPIDQIEIQFSENVWEDEA